MSTITPKKSKQSRPVFQSKLYFFIDTLIDINEINSKFISIYNMKNKIYVNDCNSVNNVGFTIYIFKELTNAEFNNIADFLKDIIEKEYKKPYRIFYKHLGIKKTSKSYDLVYQSKSYENIVEKISFIEDSDDDI